MSGKTIGIIGGSSLFHCKAFESKLKRVIVETCAGKVQLYVGRWEKTPHRIVFCQRHHADPEVKYSVPTQINFKAITLALKQLNCDEVIGVYSVGSMNPSISIGQIVIPEDFFSPFTIFHHSNAYDAHIVPGIDEKLRTKIINIIERKKEASIVYHDGGVYVQSKGPRFETRAEIRFFKTCGDYIGMTGAHEAELMNELHIPFCMIGIVDNMANGITTDRRPEQDPPLTLERFQTAQKENGKTMEMVMTTVLNQF